jgi:hypothetical protein
MGREGELKLIWDLMWAGAEFLAVSLVMTFVVSRVLLWLTKGLRDGFARIVIANGLSLVICGIVYGKLIAGTYDFHYFPDVMSAVTDFCLPQAVWLLLDVILETRRLSRAEMKSGLAAQANFSDRPKYPR